MEYDFSCDLYDIFLNYKHCSGGMGNGSSSIRERKRKKEKQRAKGLVFQVIFDRCK